MVNPLHDVYSYTYILPEKFCGYEYFLLLKFLNSRFENNYPYG